MPTILSLAPESRASASPRISTEQVNRTTVRIAAVGDIDAANAVALTEYVLDHAANATMVILDLSQIEFFGTAGFSALREIQAGCARAGVRMTLVPSSAVARVIELCERHRAVLSCTG